MAWALPLQADLVKHSPFLPPGPGEAKQPVVAPPQQVQPVQQPLPFTFNGIMQLGSVQYFTLREPAKNRSILLRNDTPNEGISIKAYNPLQRQLTIMYNGREHTLPMKTASATPMAIDVGMVGNRRALTIVGGSAAIVDAQQQRQRSKFLPKTFRPRRQEGEPSVYDSGAAPVLLDRAGATAAAEKPAEKFQPDKKNISRSRFLPMNQNALTREELDRRLGR